MPAEKPERWWLDASEVAELVGVDAKTIKRWIKSEHLKGYQLPGNGRYRVLVLTLVKHCKAHPDMTYVLERFNARYKFVSPIRSPAATTGTAGAAD